MRKFWCVVLFTIVFLSDPSNLIAQPTTRDQVRLIHVVPLLSAYGNRDELEKVVFSIQNRTDKPLDWVRVRVIVRNVAKEMIHSETWKRNLVNYYGEPLSPGLAKQVAISLNIRGYRTSKGDGSVELKVIDFGLSR